MFREMEIEVAFLLVDPAYQGRGVGKKLMEFIEQKANRKIKRVVLVVLKKNPAVNFYKRIGFKIIGGSNSKSTMEKIIL